MKHDPRDHFWFLRQRADVLKCCGKIDNLIIFETGYKNMAAVCKVCGRTHRKLIAEPGRLFGDIKG